MEEVIAVLFLSREMAHREHLATDSYAEHMALGSFYISIIDLADKLAEAYQGETGERLKDIPYYSNPMKGSILSSMKKLLAKVQEERITVCQDSTPIQNILDEIETEFHSTIYKLTFLK